VEPLDDGRLGIETDCRWRWSIAVDAFPVTTALSNGQPVGRDADQALGSTLRSSA
jgi:hypothetical protein